MIEVASFKQEHMDLMTPRACHATEVKGKTCPPVPLHTFLLDGTPIAIFGGGFVHAKFFRAWAFISDEITKVPVEFIRKTKRLLEVYMAKYELNRLEITVRSDYAVGQRFAGKIGFHWEGTMRAYGYDGSDYDLYARVRWQQ